MENGEHDHVPHREPGVDAHGYGARFEIFSTSPVPSAKFEQFLKRLVTEIAKGCLEEGARAIGHIKCHLATANGFAKADIVRMKDGAYFEGRLGSPVSRASLAINTIVLGLEGEELERITKASLSRVLAENLFSLEGR